MVCAEAKRWLQTFEREGVLHLRVHNEPTTVALFTGIVDDIDKSSGDVSSAFEAQLRRYLSPILVMRPSRSLPPLEF